VFLGMLYRKCWLCRMSASIITIDTRRYRSRRLSVTIVTTLRDGTG
jgi:hypothetical protein